jgi:hypothetical protein
VSKDGLLFAISDGRGQMVGTPLALAARFHKADLDETCEAGPSFRFGPLDQASRFGGRQTPFKPQLVRQS